MPGKVMRFHCPDPAVSLLNICKNLGDDGLLYVGIDPGLSGAIAFLPTKPKLERFVVDMPVITTQVKTSRTDKETGKKKAAIGNRNSFDYAMLVTWLDPLIDYASQVRIALERMQPNIMDTPKTAFSMGMSGFMWQLYFTAFNLSWQEYQPSSWKIHMGLKGKDKEASRLLANQLFGSCRDYFRCKSDDGRAEAMLLAEWAHRRDGGEAQAKPKSRTRTGQIV